MTRLLFFTESYPFGIGEEWKTRELRALTQRFDEVTVVPLHGHGAAVAPVPGVGYEAPLFDDAVGGWGALPAVLGSRHRAFFLRELVGSGAFRSRSRTVAWLEASDRMRRLAEHPRLARLLDGDEPVLYFFWGVGSCDLLPLMTRRVRSVVRFHRHDLYEEEHGGYLPYRRQLLAALDVAAPCSQHGRDYLAARWPEAAHKLRLLRLGTLSAGRAPASTDGVFRLVSCSRVVRVKRLELLARALERVRARVHWVHLGDGPLLPELRRHTFPANVTVELRGHLDSDRVVPLLAAGPFDLFVNVSSSEGVPVSIMEALSAGIPVLATDVGGTREIVDDQVGQLVPADVSAEALAGALDQLAAAPDPERRERAFDRFRERCDADRLSRELADFLGGLITERDAC